MSRAKRRTAPSFKFTGQVASAPKGWHAIYFDVAGDGADDETVAVLPIACWAVCLRGKDHVVGGMVAGPSGLEFAELDEDFRGYVPEDTEDARDAFIEIWEAENGFEGEEEGGRGKGDEEE